MVYKYHGKKFIHQGLWMARNTNSADRHSMPHASVPRYTLIPTGTVPVGRALGHSAAPARCRSRVYVSVCDMRTRDIWQATCRGLARLFRRGGTHWALHRCSKPCYPFIRDAQSISHWEIYAAAEKPRRSFIRWSCRAIHHLSQGNCRSNWPVTRCG